MVTVGLKRHRPDEPRSFVHLDDFINVKNWTIDIVDFIIIDATDGYTDLDKVQYMYPALFAKDCKEQVFYGDIGKTILCNCFITYKTLKL